MSVGLDTTGVYATVSGTAERMGRWLGGKPVNVASQIVDGLSADIYHSGGRPPKPVRPYVREFVALDFKVEAATTAAAANPEAPYDGVNRGTPQGCLGDAVPGGNEYIYSYNELRTAYGVDDLPDDRKVGKAARVVILAQGDGFSGEALKASADSFRPARRDVRPQTGPGPEDDPARRRRRRSGRSGRAVGDARGQHRQGRRSGELR